MNYLISKGKNDARITICGLIIPDNFFIVMGLTFKNQRQLKLIMEKEDYDVTETDLPEGHYAPNGLRVDKWSIQDWAISKTGPLVYIDEQPPKGAELVVPGERDVRPPDLNMRPDHVGIDEISVTEYVVLPAAVAKAR